MEFFDFLNRIGTQYPQAIPLLQQPGVLAVYKQAIEENWPPERLQAALEQTQWWQTTPAGVRAWQALQASDPATAAQKAADTKRIFDDLQRELGITLDTSGGLSSPSFQLFARAAAEGWDAARIRYELIAASKGQASGGDIAATSAQIKSLAGDYGVPLSDQSVMDYAGKVTQGAMTMDSVKGYLIEQAKSLFPALTTALDQGITVRQYAEPYLQLAQQELDINPADINLTDSKWMAALNQVDPKTGQRVSMSLDTWLAKIRTDPAFGYDSTSKGRQDATTLASALQRSFGAAA